MSFEKRYVLISYVKNKSPYRITGTGLFIEP
jgi:hypothetical protein